MQFSQKTLFISQLGLLIALAIIVQIIGLPQPITGPVINALLFLTTWRMGFSAGILLGCITPLVAVVRGQLPVLLAPFIPFIAMANAIMIIAFYVINYKLKAGTSSLKFLKICLAIIIAAVSKFIFLSATVTIIFPALFGYAIPQNFAALMMTPQLVTASAGGILFLILSRWLSKHGI